MILDTLQDIAAYYPKLSYQNDELIVQEPFCVLLHYHKEILQRRDELKSAALKAGPEDNSSQSVEHEHLTYLSDFIFHRSSEPGVSRIGKASRISSYVHIRLGVAAIQA